MAKNQARTATSRTPQRRILGRYIVADPAICHGKPTFLGTRIMVFQILRQVARGESWDAIAADWRGNVCQEAIAEAIALAESIKANTGQVINEHWKGSYA